MPRPKIKLPLSVPEKFLQILSVILLLTMAVLTAFSMVRLPAAIPTHFGAGGHADSWGGKSSLLFVPILSLVLYAGTTVLERFPWICNFPVEITEENAAGQYKLARLLFEWLKLIIISVFLYIQWQTVQTARGLSTGLGWLFLPVSIAALFGIPGYFIYKMVKLK